MSLRKVEKSLKELHKKLEEERMLRELPASRRPGVKRELARRVAEDEITAEQYKEITGDELRQPQPRDGTSYSVEDYHYY